MVTLPLQKEAQTVHQEYDKLRGIIDKLEEVSNVDRNAKLDCDHWKT